MGGGFEALIDVGDANNFYNHGQLLPENFIETAKSKGYDHNYFFMHVLRRPHQLP
ncbi:hypothetical protein GMDG_00349 [Pseudogymnoascus destructans 20631-21]|uniref:Uncharacterized protein n=1 Tax=Pseudogymnoascus destructans (strain ATCC MYA-4855 / 20631-21) TaxID=658429 RepID=L8G0T5_PSED2|nr:hypothetical protein GMDG_00349 [Pseudogymnoascus destructans 20631-21]